LGIVEVCGDGDDCVLDISSEVVLSDLLHLDEDESGDFFRGVKFLLSLDLNFDVWLSVFADDFVG
jgi:hypothetical protein